ncbi:MAG: hypothetical protein HC893_01905 [Chloroflexaceae bacterium]|nr:hypothetical protein [Chloroflexaceae bacterium]
MLEPKPYSSWLMRVLLLALVVLALAACRLVGTLPQTPAVDISQLATVTVVAMVARQPDVLPPEPTSTTVAPTATPTALPTLPPSPTPTATPIPPTATPAPPRVGIQVGHWKTEELPDGTGPPAYIGRGDCRRLYRASGQPGYCPAGGCPA